MTCAIGHPTLIASTRGFRDSVTVIVPPATPTLFGIADWYPADQTTGIVEVQAIVAPIESATGVGTTVSVKERTARISVPTVYAAYRCPAGFGNPWLGFVNELP